MKTDLLTSNEDYIEETFDDVSRRYSGYGKEIYRRLRDEMPKVFNNLTYYQCLTSQTQDSYAIYSHNDKSFAIQLEPIGEVIVLWNNEKQIEIGFWSKDEYRDTINFIKTILEEA